MRTRAAELASVRQDLRDRPPDLTGVPLTVISDARGMLGKVRAASTAAHATRAARAGTSWRAGPVTWSPVTEPELVAAEVRRLLVGVT